MELKDWIRAVRTSLRQSQEQFGNSFSVTKGNVSAWENGRHSPSFEQLAAMSKMSGMALPGGTDVPNKPRAYVTGGSAATALPASSSEAKYAGSTVDYEMVKEAVSGVLKAMGVRYEDLVADDTAARGRIEAALSGRPSAQTKPLKVVMKNLEFLEGFPVIDDAFSDPAGELRFLGDSGFAGNVRRGAQ